MYVEAYETLSSQINVFATCVSCHVRHRSLLFIPMLQYFEKVSPLVESL